MEGSGNSSGPMLRMFNVGFVAGILLAFACFVAAAAYLFKFLGRTSTSMQDLLGMASSQDGASFHDLVMLSMNTQMVTNKMALLSCGVFSGMAFGFLGFALFLIGARGNIELAAEGGGHKMQVSNLAPGLFVILCAAGMISLSVTQRFGTSFEKGAGGYSIENSENTVPLTDFEARGLGGSPPGSELDAAGALGAELDGSVPLGAEFEGEPDE